MENEELKVLFHACTLGRADIAKSALGTIRSNMAQSDSDFIEIISKQRVEDGLTPLHVASLCGSADVIRSLLTAKAVASKRVQIGEHKGKRPYDLASESSKSVYHVFFFEQIAMGSVGGIRNLLEGGVPVSVKDGSESDESGLHWAASFGHVDVAKLLLSYGCPVDVVNSKDQTALHESCKNNNRELVELLLSEGANSQCVDKLGHTPNFYLSKASTAIEELIKNPPIVTCTYGSMNLAAAAEIVEETNGLRTHSTEDSHSHSLMDKAVDGNGDDRGDSGGDGGDGIGCEEVEKSPLLVLWPPVQRQSHSGSTPLILSTEQVILLGYSSGEQELLQLLNASGLMNVIRGYGMTIQFSSSLTELSEAATKCMFVIDENICPGRHRFEVLVDADFGIRLTASDFTGLLYASYTLVQICQLHSDVRIGEFVTTVSIPPVHLSDWSDTPNRSVLWSYRRNAICLPPVMRDMIRYFSRLRINMILLLLDTALTTDEEETPVCQSEEDDNGMPLSMDSPVDRRKSRYLPVITSQVRQLLDELDEMTQLGAEYCVELIPAFVITSIHQRLPLLVLRNFRDPSMIVLTINFDPSSALEELKGDCPPGRLEREIRASVSTACRYTCEQIFAAIQWAGFKTVFLTCNVWTNVTIAPQKLGMKFGLNVVTKPTDDFFDKNLFVKPVACAGEMLRAITNYSKKVQTVGRSISVLPAFVDNDVCCPILLQKYCAFLYAGFAWNAPSILDMIQGENLMALMMNTDASGATTSNSSNIDGFPVPMSQPTISTILAEVISLLIFETRVEHATPAYMSILSVLTGQCLQQHLTSKSSQTGMNGMNSGGMRSDSQSDASFDSTPKKIVSIRLIDPLDLSVPSVAEVCQTDRVLWSLLTISKKTMHTASAPSRASVALCLRMYRHILSEANWKSTVIPKKSFLSAMAGFSTFNNEENVAVMDHDSEEFFVIVHLLCIVCRSIIMGYLALEKQAASKSNQPSPQVGVLPSFGELQECLAPGVKSDLANSLLEALEKCRFCLRRRFEALWFLAIDWKQGQQPQPDKGSVGHIVDSSSLMKDNMEHYLTRTKPIVPASALFDVISGQLPNSDAANDSLRQLFPTSSFS